MLLLFEFLSFYLVEGWTEGIFSCAVIEYLSSKKYDGWMNYNCYALSSTYPPA